MSQHKIDPSRIARRLTKYVDAVYTSTTPGRCGACGMTNMHATSCFRVLIEDIVREIEGDPKSEALAAAKHHMEGQKIIMTDNRLSYGIVEYIQRSAKVIHDLCVQLEKS